MDPYIGEIRLFAGNFAPRGWAFCDGSILPISRNTALFSLLGTQYGGDGRTTFALPDMRGRAPMHKGTGPGLTTRDIGAAGGSPSVTLLTNEIPSHSHAVNSVSKTPATITDPTQALWANSEVRGGTEVYTPTATTTMSPLAIGMTGASQPHNNQQPYLTLNFIIALEGVFPPRN
jgi:microcystin-dependent protein